MIRSRSHPDATLSTRRTEAYTDAVFAIAATLLVLGLTSQTFDGVKTNGDLAAALLGMWQPFVTFVVSFLLLSLMWMTHIAQFEHIARIDTVGIWINNIRLLFIVLVPFTSSLNTDFSSTLLGRVLLPANFCLALLSGWAQWAWVARHREVMVPDLDPEQVRRESGGALSALVLSGLVVAASPWLGSYAFLLFLLDGLVTRLLSGRRRPTPSDR